jgi:hypothetical protein
MALGEGGRKEVEGGSSTCLMKSKAFAGFSGSSYNATSTCEWRGQGGTTGEEKKINGSRDAAASALGQIWRRLTLVSASMTPLFSRYFLNSSFLDSAA